MTTSDDFTEHQLAKLAASGLDADYVLSKGARPVPAGERLGPEWKGSGAADPPGIMWRWTAPDGTQVEQFNPDEPWSDGEGHTVKYAFPKGAATVLNVVRAPNEDTTAVLVVEGTRQQLAVDRYAPPEYAIIGIPGCWGWSQDKMSADLSIVDGRPCVVILDADAASNPQVFDAGTRLGKALEADGATSVRFARLPASGSNGIDDLLGRRKPEKRAAFLKRVIELAMASAKNAKPADKRPQDKARQDGEDVGSKEASVATLLVQMALERYTLGVSPGGEPFAVPQTGPQLVRMLRGGRTSLRAELASVYFAQHGTAAPQQSLADALAVLEGRAGSEEPTELYLRVAEHDGHLVLDLGDTTARAVVISSTGWRVVDTPPVLFRRSALTGALPEPARDGSFDDLWALLNVAEEYRPVLAAVLVAALMPELPHPVVALVGEQGTGKSTAARVISALVDPSPAQLRRAPRDIEQWTTAASGSWVVALDNLSGINDQLSDALCRASTGDGDIRRRLYTDAELTVLAFRRVVLLNGIDLGTLADDLTDRLVTIALERIGEADRLLDAELAVRAEQARASTLGALLDLTVQVLEVLPSVRLDSWPRMADFARVLAAVDQVWGTTGLKTYLGLRTELAEDVVSTDPVVAAIVANITEDTIATAADILETITPTDGVPKGWPTARKLGAILARRGPSLRRLGWTVDKLEERAVGSRAVQWHIVPPSDEGGGEADPPPPDGDDEDDDAPPDPRLPGTDAHFAHLAHAEGVSAGQAASGQVSETPDDEDGLRSPGEDFAHPGAGLRSPARTSLTSPEDFAHLPAPTVTSTNSAEVSEVSEVSEESGTSADGDDDVSDADEEGDDPEWWSRWSPAQLAFIDRRFMERHGAFTEAVAMDAEDYAAFEAFMVKEIIEEYGLKPEHVPACPTLPAYRVRRPQHVAEQLAVWCAHEETWHYHGAGDAPGDGDGRRVPHCACPSSPYQETDYRLQEVGPFTEEVERQHGPERHIGGCPGCARKAREVHEKALARRAVAEAKEREYAAELGWLHPTVPRDRQAEMHFAVIGDGDLWKCVPLAGWEGDEPLVDDGEGGTVQARHRYPGMEPGFIGCAPTNEHPGWPDYAEMWAA